MSGPDAVHDEGRAGAWPVDLEDALSAGFAVVVRLPVRGVPYPRTLRALADQGRLRRVGRPSRWGNPIRLPLVATPAERDACIAAYRCHVTARPDLLEQVAALRGVALGCWCYPARCHADVLAELAHWEPHDLAELAGNSPDSGPLEVSE